MIVCMYFPNLFPIWSIFGNTFNVCTILLKNGIDSIRSMAFLGQLERSFGILHLKDLDIISYTTYRFPFTPIFCVGRALCETTVCSHDAFYLSVR